MSNNNDLLTNYEAARKAIFDHCGVPEEERGDYIETDDDKWQVDEKGNLVFTDGENRTWAPYYQPKLYRGESFALVNVDRANDKWHPERVWFALDNAKEIKP